MANKGNCKVDACGKEVTGKGYCARHYKMWRQGKMPKARYKTCVAPECHQRAVDKMRCEQHRKVKAEAAEAPAPAAPAPAASEPAAPEPAAAPTEASAEG